MVREAIIQHCQAKLAGLSDEDIQGGNMALIFGLSFILNFIIAAFISVFAEIAMMLGTNAILAGIFDTIICLKQNQVF